jgi:putative FmdB family regulatory protein
MPLYEYLCKKCGHKFEKLRKFSDPPIKKCPECRGVVEQLISSSAVQFKGSGWYATDYAKKSGGMAGSSNGESGKKDDKPSDKKEEKPKTESKKAEKK